MIATRSLLTSNSSSSFKNCAIVPGPCRKFTINATTYQADNRASSKLFQDAAREEAEEVKPARPSKLSILEGQNENWTGEESMQDAVLRMLVDKYKPLRSGPIRSAEEKLKQAPPKVGSLDNASKVSASSPVLDVTDDRPPRRYMASEPLLPSIEGHKPWHTTFKVPSHATSSVRYGRLPPQSSRHASPAPLDEKAKRKEREVRRRTEQAGRLSRARESTLDYRLGIINKPAAMEKRPNPVTLKGWASLVEDRIERARQEGLFRNIKGRGQPLASTTQDRNPFIAREEFLMNRIVQRQGAAPPWVEIQGELESAIASFREVVKQSWTRRAIRMLTLSEPVSLLPRLTLNDVTSLRDTEWEARERAFHDQALDEVNALVRKYNGLAPYAVRRAYYSRSAELDKAYRDSAESILLGLTERLKDQGGRTRSIGDITEGSRDTTGSTATNSAAALSFRDMIRDLRATVRGR